jgi:hypothetical protein
MRITNISASSYGTASFMIALGEPETYIQINMTEEETDGLKSMVTAMFLARQESIAKEIATASPALLADFSEID